MIYDVHIVPFILMMAFFLIVIYFYLYIFKRLLQQCLILCSV